VNKIPGRKDKDRTQIFLPSCRAGGNLMYGSTSPRPSPKEREKERFLAIF